MVLEDLSSLQVINSLKSIFSKYGILNELISDNGPQICKQRVRDFAKEYAFVHSTSSPLYLRLNGQAERMVQTAKWILIKTKTLTKH